MGTTEPVRNLDQVKELKQYFLEEKHSYRNYALVSLGCNTALRISDILKLKWKDIYDFSNEHFLEHITIQEKKTDKQNCFFLNQSAKEALEIYKNSLKNIKKDGYVFAGRYGDQKPLCRSQVFRILKTAAADLDLGNHFSCHSMRKTFGYHAWKRGIHPSVIMEIFNHSSYDITKHYLGIDQDDKDAVYKNLNL